uniref:DNA-directed RNA polymerase n=1 Tax=Heligmosomoides polygyrus TaxID=6339 RepID=A0A8L8KQD7_HELPZ
LARNLGFTDMQGPSYGDALHGSLVYMQCRGTDCKFGKTERDLGFSGIIPVDMPTIQDGQQVYFKSLGTIAEMVHEVAVFLVDVVHNGIFSKAGKRGVEIPVDGRSGTPLLELRGLLSLTRKAEPRAKEAVVRSRVELGDNGNLGQAILAIKDDVVDLVVELATGGFPDIVGIVPNGLRVRPLRLRYYSNGRCGERKSDPRALVIERKFVRKAERVEELVVDKEMQGKKFGAMQSRVLLALFYGYSKDVDSNICVQQFGQEVVIHVLKTRKGYESVAASENTHH